MPLQATEPPAAQPTSLRGSSSVLRRGSSAALRKLKKATNFAPSIPFAHSDNAAHGNAPSESSKPHTAHSVTSATYQTPKGQLSLLNGKESAARALNDVTSSSSETSHASKRFEVEARTDESRNYAATFSAQSFETAISTDRNFCDSMRNDKRVQSPADDRSASHAAHVHTYMADPSTSYILSSELHQQWRDFARYETGLMLCAGVLYESTLCSQYSRSMETLEIPNDDNRSDESNNA